MLAARSEWHDIEHFASIVLGSSNGQAYFLSPLGDNRNNGKSIDQPMRSLSGLVAAYDLDAGDVVELNWW